MPERFVFSGLRELFAKANEEKSGDQLAGLAAGSERERVAAKRKLADLSLATIVQQPLIDPDKVLQTACRRIWLTGHEGLTQMPIGILSRTSILGVCDRRTRLFVS